MKLVSFQSLDAVKDLLNKGYLESNESYIDLKKANKTYSWVLEKMNNATPNKFNTKYPIWCWVKCYNNICPPKHKGKKVKGFDVKITFHKEPKDIFITDYRRYSFLLKNMYIPTSLKDKEKFEHKLEKLNITNEELKAYVRQDKYKTHRTDQDFLKVCEEIRKSFDKCITTNSNILQGCVWRINLSEVESIEILNDENYCYGSLNYKRSNGKRFDWLDDFYKNLK